MRMSGTGNALQYPVCRQKADVFTQHKSESLPVIDLIWTLFYSAVEMLWMALHQL